MWQSRRRRAGGTLAALACLVGLVASHASASLDDGFGSGPNRGVVQLGPATGGLVARAIGSLADGSIIAATQAGVWKYSAAGVLDASFGQSGVPGFVSLDSFDPVSVSVDSSGRIVVTGSRLNTGIGPGDPVVIRMSSSGVIDTGFVGAIDPYRFRVSAPVELGNKIVVTTYEWDGSACLHRLVASDGTLDPSFGTSSSGSVCVGGLAAQFETVTGAYGLHHADGRYTLYVPVQTQGGSDVAGSRIDVIDFSAAGVQQGSLRVIPEVPGEYIMTGLVATDGSFFVAGLRNGNDNSFIRKYVGEALEPTFAAAGGTPGVASVRSLRIEHLTLLGDGRVVALGSVGFEQAQVRLLTADGRPDGALQPDGDSPDRISLPFGTYTGWAPNGGSFVGATVSNGRVVLIGDELDRVGLSYAHRNAVIARSGAIGPPAPMSHVPGSYVPVVPERLLDTRPDVQVGYAGPKPVGGTTVRLRVTGVGTTQVPTNAKAVVLNVTGTEATRDGYITAWPCGSERPLASNLNLVTGGTRPNVVVVGVGSGGEVCLFTQNGAHLIADISGYFTANSAYMPTVPARVLDTRTDGQVGYAGPKPTEGAVIELQVAGNSPSLAPLGTAAVVLNLTGTEVEQGTYVQVFDCGTNRPFVSNLNVDAGETVSNLVIAPVAADGKICLFTLRSAHLVADLSGWFPANSSYAPVTPDRLLDTREQGGFGGYFGPPPAAGATVQVPVIGGRPGVPIDASAVILNVVGIDTSVGGYITVWPCGTPRPLASNLNLTPRGAAAGLVVAGVGANGSVCLYTQNGADLIVDIFGYIAPR